MRSFKENRSDLVQSKIMIDISQMGFTFKIPILCYDKIENTPGLLMSLFLFSGFNFLTFLLHKRVTNSDDSFQSKNSVIAYENYKSNSSRA